MKEMFCNGTSVNQLSFEGPSVLLVHGLGLNKKMWDWQTKELSKLYSVISYDLYGHGQSEMPDGKINLSMFSNQIKEIMEYLEIKKTALLGFSLGGMIVRKFAIDHEEKLWALGILNSAHKRSLEAKHAVQKRVEQVKKFGPSSTVEDALERWFTEEFRSQNYKIMNLIREWVLANNKDVYPKIYQLLVDGVDELVEKKLSINCPTLVLTGDEDYGNSPEMSKEISKQIDHSQTMILKGLRHMALIEAPEILNKILIEFLNESLKNY